MKLQVRFPAGPDASVEEIINGVTGGPTDGPLTVGDPRVIDFLTSFARRLLMPSIARRHPELGSLGFFLRRTEIYKTVDRLRQGVGSALVFPRGLVFHVPPANVETIFVYSWALSALAGNHNIIRISARSAGATSSVLAALNETLDGGHPAVAQTQCMVTYGRNDEVTAAFSHACGLRLIWGGDRTVRDVRRHPLAPWARDVTFPDRTSYAAISVAGWLAAAPRDRKRATEGLVNDTYWFDQAACSSPRAVFLVGDPVGAERVRTELLSLLSACAKAQGFQVDAAMVVEKQVNTYGLAAIGAATSVRFTDNTVTDVTLSGAHAMPRSWLGAGVFPFAVVGSLSELARLTVRQDQTFSHFGFERAELVAFAQELAGRGIDRMVPFGQALSFSAFWDGYDLIREFTRLVTIEG